ncbi:MAG: cardiolipin synthase [Treponemataceae bacterium]|nr:cardiolipin synthase [Treponemataceae bacterium]
MKHDTPARSAVRTRIQKKLLTAKNILYTRLLMTILLLCVQLCFLFLMFLKFESYMEYVFGGSIFLSLLFIAYLMNCSGKNEFKITWILPVVVLPIFGISLYFLYRMNWGGIRLKKGLAKVKEESAPLLSDLPESEAAFRAYPKVRDIATYLYGCGAYPAYTNTAADYFPSGEAVFPDMLAELKKARQFIFIEFFIIEPSKVWADILVILRQKVREGVEVRVLYDSLGSVQLSSRQNELYLRSLGIKAKIFMPFVPIFDTGLNNRDHRKILSIDGQVAYTGGVNLSDEYMNFSHPRFQYWKDTAIKIRGPAVRTFTTMFLQNWYLANRKEYTGFEDYRRYVEVPYPVEAAQGAVIPYGDDAFNNCDIAENVYNYIISKSHEYVHILTPYIIVDNTLLDAMLFAAARGVDVSVIVPMHYDHYITFCVGRRYIKTLIENGIHVYGYEPGFIHAKVFVSDNKRGTVGSVNLDYRSLYHHFECGAYLYDSPTIQKLEADFQETRAQSVEITMEVYKSFPLIQRILGWLFRMFGPLL